MRAFVSLRVPALVLERLGTEQFERGLVRAWVDVAHEDEAVEWVGRKGCGLGLSLGEGGRWVRWVRGWARLDSGDASQSLRMPSRPTCPNAPW